MFETGEIVNAVSVKAAIICEELARHAVHLTLGDDGSTALSELSFNEFAELRIRDIYRIIRCGINWQPAAQHNE